MIALTTELRDLLERTVKGARRAGEAGAKKALEALDVGRPDAGAGLGKETLALRRLLRAHARQLGDSRDAGTGAQGVSRLTREVAYEHWHRMLFARFLAENGLLIEPTRRVVVTLEEVEGLAREGGLEKWRLAASYAQEMLPAIFRSDDPSLAVALPPETQQTLEALLAGLPPDVFRADDALGWTYQFWQSDEKKRVNESAVVIGADELPAVTQLFTEHYMVDFLLHNTLGAWHAGKILVRRSDLLGSAESEGALRAAVAVSGYTFDYLRFVRSGEKRDGPWRVAAGTHDTWPRAARDVSVLDPCCGSGHFLVAAFDLLVRLRMQEEGLSLRDAILSVLRENLFGLELDARCVQIAAFAVALHAWKWLGEPLKIPIPNIACCGLSVGASRDDWVARAGADSRLREGMAALHELFQRAPVLGALIDPARMAGGDLHIASLDEVGPTLVRALDATETPEAAEAGIAARGMLDAIAMLRRRYTLVLTNPPYLGRGKQGLELAEYADTFEKESRQDLATVFMSRALRWCAKDGTVAMVLPQNWLFLTRYTKLRQRLLRERTWSFVARLGEHAFESAEAAGAFAALVAISGAAPSADASFIGLDVSNQRGEVPIHAKEKARLLGGASPTAEAGVGANETLRSDVGSQVPGARTHGECSILIQAKLAKGPDARVVMGETGGEDLLETRAVTSTGMQTFDRPRFVREFWELAAVPTSRWKLLQTGSSALDCYHGMSSAVRWDGGSGELAAYMSALAEDGYTSGIWRAGSQFWGRRGVAMSLMGELRAHLYVGDAFDTSVGALIPRDVREVTALWCFASSDAFRRAVRQVDQKVMVTNATLGKVEFDHGHWAEVAGNAYPQGLPDPQSNDPTQWLFHGHPAGMAAAGRPEASPLAVGDLVGPERHASLVCREVSLADVLQVAVARLVGYQWPAELASDIPLDVAARDWVGRCAELRPLADEDGVVPVSRMRGEASAAERLEVMLRTAFGTTGRVVDAAVISRLLSASSSKSGTLDEWLRNEFFEQHCALSNHRPFVWHIWDGRPDGFQVLVHYHRLAAPDGQGRRLLEKIAHAYLGEWIDRQRAEQRERRDGADARLEAALQLQRELEAILLGEPPYDIFVRWKALSEQPIGWEPSVDDGIRLNIRPFLLANAVRNRGAGVLRARPNVKWGVDRGSDPEGLRPKAMFPWCWCYDPENPGHQGDFAGTSNFDGKRWNDLHFSLKARRAARVNGGGK